VDRFVKGERAFPLDHDDWHQFGCLGMFIVGSVEHGWNLNSAELMRVSGGKVSLLGIEIIKGKKKYL
jgi:hypothetical protein